MVKTLNELYIEYIESMQNHDKIVLHFNDTEVTFHNFVIRVEEIMRQLIRLGVREGQGVGYTLTNCLDVIPLFIAISRLGAYSFPIFDGFPAEHVISSYKRGNISYIITNKERAKSLQKACDAMEYKALVVVVEKDEEFESIMGDAQDIDIDIQSYCADITKEDLPLMIGLSSGTTGVPKMVTMTQRNIGSEIIVMKEMENLIHEKAGITADEDSKIVAFPLSTSVMLTVLGMLFSKEKICFTDNMSPMNFLKQIEKCKARGITCPPAYLESLLLLKESQKFDLSSVITIEGGMDFFSASLIRRMSELLPNLKIYGGGYGLVETCNVYMYKVMNIHAENMEDTARYVLAKQADNVIRICNEEGQDVLVGETGEVYVKGSNVVRGYMESPNKLKEEFKDGWLKTGDIAEKIDDRTIHLLGREKFFIKRGGKSVSPIVVQAQINKTSGVKDSAVVGVPHPLFGEMIWAFVVKKEGQDVLLKDIKKTCKEFLPYYMLPDQVTFIEDIPKKSGVGKVDFETIRNMGVKELQRILK